MRIEQNQLRGLGSRVKQVVVVQVGLRKVVRSGSNFENFEALTSMTVDKLAVGCEISPG